jgi:hypothetical protein
MNVSKWSAWAIDLAAARPAACRGDVLPSGLSFGDVRANRSLDPGVFVPGVPDAVDQPLRAPALARHVTAAGAAESRHDGAAAHACRFGAGPS